MEKIGRQRRGESEWREIVQRQTQSGLSVLAFCELEGIKSASLYGWRSRLREEPRLVRAVPAEAKQVRDSAPPLPGFIDLGPLESGRSRFEVRLELGSGVLLHLVRD